LSLGNGFVVFIYKYTGRPLRVQRYLFSKYLIYFRTNVYIDACRIGILKRLIDMRLKMTKKYKILAVTSSRRLTCVENTNHVFSNALRKLEADTFCLCLAHTIHSKIYVSYFQRTGRSSSEIKNLKTDFDSSWTLLEIDFPTF